MPDSTPTSLAGTTFNHDLKSAVYLAPKSIMCFAATCQPAIRCAGAADLDGDTPVNQPNRSQLLDLSVEQLLQNPNFSTLRYYWGLYKRAFPHREIQAFYVFYDPATGYGNVVVLGQGEVIDIEGDDSTGTGYLGIQSLASISAVGFHKGQLQGLVHSQGASLVVFTRLVGETTAGPYWIARTEPEEEQLILFARFLVDSIRPPEPFGD